MLPRVVSFAGLVVLFLSVTEARRGTWIPVPGGPSITCPPPVLGCTNPEGGTLPGTVCTADGCPLDMQTTLCYTQDCATNNPNLRRCACNNVTPAPPAGGR